MKPTWDAMAMGIALQPVPPELCKVVTIKCNDCEKVQEGRSWHFLGVQCRHCESFNTVVEKITMIGAEAHEFLLRNDEGGVGSGGGEDAVRQRQAHQPPVPREQGVNGDGGGDGVGRATAQPAAGHGQTTNGGPRARRRRRASMAAAPSSGFMMSPPPPPPPPFG